MPFSSPSLGLPESILPRLNVPEHGISASWSRGDHVRNRKPKVPALV